MTSDISRSNSESLENAESLYREALAASRAVAGDKHNDTLSIMGNLGSILQKPGQLEEAASLLQEAVAGLQALSHRDARTFQERLDQTRSQMDRLREREQRQAKARTTM